MAWTTTDRDRLKAAIASGTKKVKYADKEVEYHSVPDMLRALEMIEAELRPRTKRSLVSTGYYDGN